MKACERCGTSLDKKHVNGFDSTRMGRRKNGEKLKLCRNCLFDKFSEYLSRYDARALAVYPMKDKHVNAYVFYTIEELAKTTWKTGKWPLKYAEQIRQTLPPPNTMCQSCRTRNALFAWCSPEIYSSNYVSDKLNPEGTYRREFLCGNCLAVEFRNKVSENDDVFEEFMPPVDVDGFLTSWEV